MVHFVLLSFISIFSTAEGFAESALFKKKCKAKISKYKSLSKACSSGEYDGQKIYKCKKKCKKRKGFKCKEWEWDSKQLRVCNSDGEKKGYYIGTCAGKNLNASSWKKACAQKNAKGQTVVYCKKGKEKKRQTCSSTTNNDSKKNETRVFIEKCGGSQAKKKNGKPIKTNLSKACKQNNLKNKVLVRCNNTCMKRSGLKCVKWTWKEKKRAICGANKKVSNMKTCNETQAAELARARTDAIKDISNVIVSMESFIKNPQNYYSKNKGESSFSKKQKSTALEYMKKAKKTAGKIRSSIKTKTTKLICQGNKSSDNSCSSGSNAHALRVIKRRIWFCSNWLGFSDYRKAAVFIHEYSHHHMTNDITYDRSKLKNIKWHKNAETYEMWAEDNKICIPGYDC